MKLKYKYTKAELARKIHDIEFAGLSIEERNIRFQDLLEDAGDIPVWSPYTLKAFLKEMAETDERDRSEFFSEEYTDSYMVDCLAFDGKYALTARFSSYTEAYNHLMKDMPGGEKDLRLILRIPKSRDNQYSEHRIVIASYNAKGEITGWGGEQWQFKRNRLHQIYDEFEILSYANNRHCARKTE